MIALWRWVYDKEETTLKQINAGKSMGFFVKSLKGKMVSNKIKNQTQGQGIGRHTQAEVMKMGEDDIRAVGEFLGEFVVCLDGMVIRVCACVSWHDRTL